MSEHKWRAPEPSDHDTWCWVQSRQGPQLIKAEWYGDHWRYYFRTQWAMVRIVGGVAPCGQRPDTVVDKQKERRI